MWIFPRSGAEWVRFYARALAIWMRSKVIKVFRVP